LTVVRVNLAPKLNAVLPQLGQETSSIDFSLAAGDADGDQLSYFVDGQLPKGATYDPGTQHFSWTPDFGQAGNYTFQFGVIDAGGLTDTTAVQVQVLHVNRPPQIQVSNHSAVVGQPLHFVAVGTDP